MKYTEEEFQSLSTRKRIELLHIYPKVKWIYVRFYSWYGFYWAYKLCVFNYKIPYWEQWALWFFAMCSLYFFAREERLDGFFNGSKSKVDREKNKRKSRYE